MQVQHEGLGYISDKYILSYIDYILYRYTYVTLKHCMILKIVYEKKHQQGQILIFGAIFSKDIPHTQDLL